MDDELLTDAHLAKRWKVSARTIKNWRRAGKPMPPALKIGRRGGFGQGVMTRLSDVIAFEEARMQYQPEEQ